MAVEGSEFGCREAYEKRPVVAVFDFDGTLINGDSFLIFSRAYAGTAGFLARILACSPWLVAWKLGLTSNANAKQHLFSALYKGLTAEDFRNIAIDNIQLLRTRIKTGVFEKLRHHVGQGDRVYIVTAGFSEWLEPLFEGTGIRGILATGVEIDSHGILSGRFCTPNCYGPEKVRRLLEVEPRRDSYILVAYGDSAGDSDMKSFADSFILIKK